MLELSPIDQDQFGFLLDGRWLRHLQEEMIVQDSVD